MVDATATFAQSPNVIARQVDGETVLLDLESSTYFGLNAVGSCIWALLGEGPKSLDAIADMVTAQYDIDRATASSDIAALLSELEEQGLIVRAAV